MSDVTTSTTGLACSGVCVTYGSAVAVDNLALTVPAGAVTVLLGPNGAGKSSTLLALYGAVRASGRVELDGEPIDHLRQHARMERGIALMPQGRQLFPGMTVEENLRVIADVHRLGKGRVERGLAYFPILVERRRTPADLLSGGQQRMLGLARAMMLEPRVLLLDEPVDGLAVGTVKELMTSVQALARSGVAVLMAEPVAGPILRWVDRGYVVLRGRLRGARDSADEVETLYEQQLGLADAPLLAELPYAKS